jgi:SAM-dependent methyltransferase
MPTANTWETEGYLANAAFVPALGSAVFDLLAPRAGERILDLGCGEGSLTEQIAATGAVVIGVDASEDFAAAARARGLDVRIGDGEALTFEHEFDAVFSNAAMHWMLRPDRVIEGVRRALKPGGRFVAEFGGHACVAAVHTALRAVLARRGVETISPWYFPTDVEYRGQLEAGGFVVQYIALIPRPTPLPTGMAGWLATFGSPMFGQLPEGERADAAREVEQLLRPALCDTAGHWTADYVRLRFAATLPT